MPDQVVVTAPGPTFVVAGGQGPSGPQGDSGTAKAINVEDYGANAASLTNYAAITAAIAASSAGDTIFFPHIYNVEQMPLFKPFRTYKGSNRNQSGLKMAPGANLDAVACSEGWAGSSITTAEGPITIEHMGFDGNRNNQTAGLGHGFVGMNFWSRVEDCDFINARGDGLRWSASRRDGVEISGSMVENHFEKLFIRNVTGYGFRVFDPTPSVQTITDGYLEDVDIQSPGEDAVRIDCAQGWLIHGNHIYTAGKHGIHVNRAGACTIDDNYIETWGTNSTPATYAAICCGDNSTTFVGDPYPLTITNNRMFFAGGAAGGSNIRGILCSTSNGNTSHIVIGKNGVYNTGVQVVGVGVRVVNQGATAATLVSYGTNRVDGWPPNSRFTVAANGGTMVVNGDSFPQVLATTATAGFARLPSVSGRPTAAPAETADGIAAVVNTLGPELCLYTGGAWYFQPLGTTYGHTGRVEANAPGTGLSYQGALSSAANSQTTSTNVTNSQGHFFSQSTSSSANTLAYIHMGAWPIFPEHLPRFVGKFRIGSTITNARYFIGMTQTIVGTELGNDDPSLGRVGLQYSTNRGDTTFKVIHNTNTGSWTRVDTGVTPVAGSSYILDIAWLTTAQVLVKLRDHTGAVLFSTTITTNLPATGTGMQVMGGVQTLDAVSKSWGTSFWQLQYLPFT